jgi:hypothetical protein
MSEQNASVAQTYAIAVHFSERARRAAVAQKYEVTYGTPIRRVTYPMPRTRIEGERYCPLGVMEREDGMALISGSPIPDSVACDILQKQGLEVPEHLHSSHPLFAQFDRLRAEAADFTRDWDTCKLQPKDLAAALGLVPPSTDATDGD